MKSNVRRMLTENAAFERQDKKAAKDRNQPFGFYMKEFWGLEDLRQDLLKLNSKHGGDPEVGNSFKDAAIKVEMAQNAMLKAGRLKS